ncbi:SDR family oxidoreductase [Pseudomonas sp. CCC3.2]|uniref:SDR family oxidoreductase n=1 Tax=unclassified Pseudomonas TaxID=196821 RepID=UPI002AB569C5|nr:MULTISPECIES: SDR family oxidoreductase [unclassified Pseudomonas]MDY7562568.1 SDR family oxidoreductase [Pseudomonas sp. AB6]MEA9979638.1 SDR family oxidoreductase [Pseudomonas sp. RTS4]MEB0182346.1 SDR family oxidoreductase [Pseudomonas sp. CCC3.2]MEB0199737.1 SDR family oxidoreductase [Pseudomonas sp. 5S4]MEB0213510.1 SDR family oxidoreductase [Pseudomonas sp. AB6]
MKIPQDVKIAFITGANRGIGLETAKQLGKLGYYPVIGARSESAGKDAVSQLKAVGIDAGSIVFDVTDAVSRQNAFDYFTQNAGRLDVLINNAGVHLEGEPAVEHLFSASTVPEKVLRETMEANFFAPVALIQKLLPLLRESSAGRIVNLSSILGSLALAADPASPIYEMKSAAYDTSKTAINSYTIQLAHELRGSTIKVNSAHPGWVQTAMGGSAAPMSIEEGAKTSVMLATLPVDGPNGGFFHMGAPLPF